MIRRAVLALLFAWGCHPWITSEVPAPDLSLLGNPQQVRVVLKDGSSTILMHPVITRDTLTGDTRGGLTTPPSRVSIPMARIAALQVRKFSGIATTSLVLVLGALAVAIFYAYMLGSMDT